MRHLFVIMVVIACSIACADQSTNNTPPKAESETTAPSTNAPAVKPKEPIKLQSAETNAPPARVPKPIAIILRDVYVLDILGQQVMVIPERYLHDLTNIYRGQYIPKVGLQEP